MTRPALIALPIALMLAASSTPAADGYSIELGHGSDSTDQVRLRHISNAGLEDPNDGITFHQVRLTYNY